MEESSEKSETDSQLSIILEDTDIDPEDLQGASLDNALDTTEGKNRPKRIAYNLQEFPLPKLTKSGKDYLNQINSPAIDFKEKTIATHSGFWRTL
ncbi:hypothetical protein C1646_764544 [Rhizophagus diaphanus]|nr:hypothetical protein C1646_764544 [Rhizophagus diaphanus] [Rhizophagus sp. MUCL 43196]